MSADLDRAASEDRGTEVSPGVVLALLFVATVAVVWSGWLATRRVDGTPVWQWAVIVTAFALVEWILLR